MEDNVVNGSYEEVEPYDIAGGCPRCGQESLYAAGRSDGASDDLLPMCTDIDGCGWTGTMAPAEERCVACGDMLLMNTPALYTRYYGKKSECVNKAVVASWRRAWRYRDW